MMWGWGAGWMFLWMALFWIGVVLLIIWGVNQLTRDNRARPDRALEVLEERYARGEIDSDEFETRRQTLRG
jgi:putative membrane protein